MKSSHNCLPPYLEVRVNVRRKYSGIVTDAAHVVEEVNKEVIIDMFNLMIDIGSALNFSLRLSALSSFDSIIELFLYFWLRTAERVNMI